jgi:hypothetical protein
MREYKFICAPAGTSSSRTYRDGYRVPERRNEGSFLGCTEAHQPRPPQVAVGHPVGGRQIPAERERHVSLLPATPAPPHLSGRMVNVSIGDQRNARPSADPTDRRLTGGPRRRGNRGRSPDDDAHDRYSGSARRFKGQSGVHNESDLRAYLHWCVERGLDPLAATRLHIELYVRWMQEQRRYAASTPASPG